MFFRTYCLFFAGHTVLALSENLDACGETFVKVGCYKDETRPLPELLLNKRLDHELSAGWNDWENFLKGLACSCANITRSKGFTYFGLQFYGECWGGVKPNVTYAHDGISLECVGQNLQKPCEQAHPVCVGKGRANYVYELISPTSGYECKDYNSKCPEYAIAGFCKQYSNIRSHCPYSCNEC